MAKEKVFVYVVKKHEKSVCVQIRYSLFEISLHSFALKRGKGSLFSFSLESLQSYPPFCYTYLS